MKAYRYTLNTAGVPRISLRVFEAVEHKKYYEVTIPKSPLVRKVHKQDVAIVSGDNNDTVWLMEDDFEWAKEIFGCYIDNKCFEIENSIMRKQANIELNKRNKEFINKMNAPEREG